MTINCSVKTENGGMEEEGVGEDTEETTLLDPDLIIKVECDDPAAAKEKIDNENDRLLHHEPPPPVSFAGHTCDQCQFVTGDAATFKVHMKARHQIRCYPCDVCAYVSFGSNSLKAHKEYKHEGKRHQENKL